MRGSVLLRVVVLGGALAALAMPAAAQQRPQSKPQYNPPIETQPYQVQPFSAERQMQRYNQPTLPDPVRDRARAERDRLKRLGLPYFDPDAKAPGAPGIGTPGGATTPGGIGITAVPGSAPPDPNFSRMDTNRDGIVSRQEYLNAQSRTVPPSVRNTWRERPFVERANSRFRTNDLNKDGRITPDKMSPSPAFAPPPGPSPGQRFGTSGRR
jgi:hypothetical protein